MSADKDKRNVVLKGAVVYSDGPGKLVGYDSAYVVCEEGICRGVFEELPEKYADFPMEDLWDRLIMPGFTDLHTHAPQYQNRGLGYDLKLLDWLMKYTYPEEMRYSDRDYALRAYDMFAEDLYLGPTTRACVFATKHARTTLMLMEALEDTGLVTYVGKVNMDRNVPEGYSEKTEVSLDHTEKWLKRCKAGFENTYPIITPRFTPSCSRELMDGLGRIAEREGLPVQSHLSESRDEIAWVHELEPDAPTYAATYDRSGLFGSSGKCVMAHCVWSSDEEIELMKERGVYIAHCPASNANLASGIAPVSTYLENGMHVGLGTDVSGGHTASVFDAMREAISASRLRWSVVDGSVRPITFSEAFYMATEGGGSFFGNVGTFRDGYEFDAVVIDDSTIMTMLDLSAIERAERCIYLADDRNVVGKYVRGRKLY